MSGFRGVSAVVAGLLLAVTGCAVDRAGGAAAEEVTVLSFAQPNDGAPPPQLQAWADDVSGLSDGTVEIRFENGWRIGEVDYEVGTIDDVRAGEVDLAWVGARAFDVVGVTSFQALLAPLLVDSHDLQRAVFEEGIPGEMLGGVDEVGVVGVGVLPGPMRKLLGVTGSLVSPADLEGAVVGMQDSALVADTLRTLGATPKAVPSSAELEGLDGYEQQLGSIAGNGYQEGAHALASNLNLWPRPHVIIANPDVHDSLTSEQQEALREATRSVLVDALVGAANEDEETGAIMCESRLAFESLSEDALATFRDAVEPVYSSLRQNPETARFLDRIEALKATLAVPPDTFECEESPAASGAIPNGTYQYTVTRADVEADVEAYCEPEDPTTAAVLANAPDEPLTLELRISGDRIVQSQFPAGRPEAKEVGWTGTYRTYRDTFELIETGFSKGVPLTWSYDGEELRLSDPPLSAECDSVLVWTSHPWVRVDDTP